MAMEIGKQIGRRIKEFRESRGLTQAQLAQLSGKSVETISNFERGKVVTGLHTLDQLARLLNVRIKDFFDDEGGIPPEPAFPSASAQTLANALKLLSEDDLEVLAAVAGVLESQRRRKRG